MERGSNKVSPRLDDEMTHEAGSLIQSGQTETRSDPSLFQEGLLPDEQPQAGAPSAHLPASPGQLSDAEVEERSELALWLEPHEFPATGAQLAEGAAVRGAPERVLERLRRAAPGDTYPTPASLWEATGGAMEPRA